MANNPSTLPGYNGQTAAPDANYPFGSARDDASPGDLTGTPRIAAEINDVMGFQQALLNEALIIPTGSPDTALSSQYLKAMLKLSGITTASYTTARALVSARLTNGSIVNITDDDIAGTFVVKSGAVTDNGGTLIVFTDDSNRHLSRIIEGDIFVEWFGVNTANDAATNTPLFHATWDFAAGRRTRAKNKRYKYEGSYSGTIVFIAEQRPTVNTARTALENGTALVGTTNFSGDYVYLIDVACDHGSAAFGTGADAIKVSALPYNSGRLCVLHGVVGLGRNDNDAFHGVLVEGYDQIWIKDCVGGKNQFCGAFKSRNTTLDGWRGIGGQNIIIFKSDVGAAGGSLSFLNASKIIGEGTANTIHGVRVLSDNDSIESVNISDVNIRDSDRLLSVEATTAISEANFSNFNGKRIRTVGVVSSGAIFQLNLTNFNLAEVDIKAMNLQGGKSVNVQNFYASATSGISGANLDSFVQIDAGVTGFTSDNIELVENYGVGAGIGTVLLNNARKDNLLSKTKAKIAGSRPLNGFNDQALSGASNVLTPLIDMDRNRSTMKLTATANVTITDIDHILSGTSNLPEGYVVQVLVISAFTFTFQNGTDLRNRAGADLVLPFNKILTYTWFGDSWYQSDNTL